MDDAAKPLLPVRRNRIFYGWWIVCACFLISVYVGVVIFYGFTAFFDPLVREFGWSYTQISIALSLRGIEMSLLAPAVGFLVDRYGSRLLALWGVITIGIGLVLLSLTQSVWMFYASFILIAFGGGGCTAVVFMRVVANWFQRRMGLALGILISGFGASGLLVPIIVWLIDAVGWRPAVVILGAGMWVIGIPLGLVVRNSPEEMGLLPDGGTVAPAAKVGPETPVGDGRAISFRDAVKQKAFLLIALSEGIRMTAVAAVATHIMPYLNLLQMPRTKAGLVAGAVPVLSIIGRFVFGWLSDTFDKRNMTALSLGMMSLGMFALGHVDAPWAMALFLILFPTGFGGAITLRGVFIREYFGLEAFGRLLGIVMGFSAVGGMVGPTLAGFVFDTLGTYRATWIGLGIASSFTVLLIMGIAPKGKRA